MTPNFEFVGQFVGTVVAVDEDLCYLTFHDHIRVYVALYAAHQITVMPKVGIEVVFIDLLMHDNDYYLNNTSLMLFNHETDDPKLSNNDFVQLIRKYKLDMIQLYDIYHLYPVNCLNVCTENGSKIKLQMLIYFLKQHCKTPSVSLPCNLKYLKLEKKYNNFPYYSHGMQHNDRNEYMMGQLTTNQYALCVLSDNKTSIYMKINTENNHQLLNYIGKIVIIKKFIYCSELYSEATNMEYILCDINDITILNLKVKQENNPILLCDNLMDDFKWIENHVIYINNIAPYNSTAKQLVECWLEIQIFKNKSWTTKYLCLPPEYFKIIPILDIGNVYNLYLSKQLVPHNNFEIKRVANNNELYKLLNNSGVFVRNTSHGIPPGRSQILDVKSICQLNSNSSMRYINFEGTISLKIFSKPDLQSRTKKHSSHPSFGTPGSKLHVIRFELAHEEHKISLYLNNWEQKQQPIGLLPQIKVLVRHVEFSKHYLRSNAMTSFKILGYNGPIIYNTANLNDDNPKIFYAFIGDGHFMPTHVLIRTKAVISKMQSLVLELINNQLSIVAYFFVSDEKGEAFVICKQAEFLKKILFSDDAAYATWLAHFKMIGHLNIKQSYKPTLLSPEMQVFYSNTLNYITKYVENKAHIEMLCRRLEANDKTDNNGTSIWQATEIIQFNTC